MHRATTLTCLGILPLLLAPSAVRASEACRESPEVRIWWSPENPSAGAPLRLMVVSEEARDGTITVTTAGRPVQKLQTVRRGGPPFSFSAELPAPPAGEARVALVSDSGVVSCHRISVAPRGRATAARGRSQGPGAWPVTRAWNRTLENLYSAWIERLFDAPADAALGFPSLAPAIRDPARNFLWGHLGLREDDPKNRAAPPAVPDCADLPYYLRATFAWKMGLPFGLRDCNRGTSDHPPTCGALVSQEEPLAGTDALDRFRKFLRLLANKVHSGSARTALEDDETDFYPVKLARDVLRPGLIYADPYGHVMMIAKWVEQDGSKGGRLFAVDGQPDNSVGRKRFWEGTFLFASDVKSAGPGFKAFRPLEKSADTGSLVALSNRALATDRRFAPFSAEQASLSRDDFYARMAKLINPKGLFAQASYEETLNALVEQLETRLGSVDNGERFMRDKGNPVVPMPVGAKIFETVGPWEDYATPSRDMRLLIALDVLARLPARASAHPELFVLGGRKPEEIRAELEKLHQRRIHERSVEYRRSDGTPFKLTVADVYARRTGLEMAYNPNDCVELRWGADAKTADYATCNRHAPAEQRSRMLEYRPWFHEARRPAR
ncbi:MAG TPA: hypothetical protein VJ801_00185 [Polyangia bacterium]|nr:hypothetical protein [Polyangia bacterium]